MAKRDTLTPQFHTLLTPKCTGVGFTKWTSSQPDIRQFYERATRFIELTGLMPRADSAEGELIESDII